MRIIHVFSTYENANELMRGLNGLAAETWKTQQWEECPVNRTQLTRLWKERSMELPYIKDVIDIACCEASDSDIVVYTNTDTCVCSTCSQIIQSSLKSANCVYAYRRDFEISRTQPIPDAEIETGFPYSGSDLYAFRVAWWRANRSQMPDMLLGMEAWDPILRSMMDRSHPVEDVCLKNIIYHRSHPALWNTLENHYRLEANKHNLRLAFHWMRVAGMDPAKHSIPVPEDDPNYQALIVEKWTQTIKRSDHIWSWTGYPELAYIMEQASKSSFAVEIGTYLGRSAKALLDANPLLHLWCVDPGLVAGVYETSAYFLRDEIAAGRCELMRKYSPQAAQMLEHMRNKLDLVWVDDGHATEDVMRDIKHFLPLLHSGGVLCGHDFEIPYNDVALGVTKSLPSWTVPVPRVWSYIKP